MSKANALYVRIRHFKPSEAQAIATSALYTLISAVSIGIFGWREVARIEPTDYSILAAIQHFMVGGLWGAMQLIFFCLAAAVLLAVVLVPVAAILDAFYGIEHATE